MSWKSTCRALGLAMIAMVVLQACGDKPAQPPQAAQASPAFDSPISITHKLGTTTITRPPGASRCWT